MRVILKSLDTLLAHLPNGTRELISQFTFYNNSGNPIPTEFDAKISIDEVEELGFKYLHIKGEEFMFTISDNNSEIEVDINELNYKYDNVNWEEQVNDSINGYGSFSSVVDKIRKSIINSEKRQFTHSDLTKLIGDYLKINKDEYDIICLEGDYFSVWDAAKGEN